MPPEDGQRDLGRRFFMESVIVACITGVVTLVGVILSNSKSRAVMEVKLDALTAKVEKHNQVLERTYQLEQDMAVAKHDIEEMQRSARK
jgi:Tfp pilus assembly protein PilE